MAGSLFGALVLTSCGGESNGDLDPGSASAAPEYGSMIEAAPPKLRKLYEGEGAGGLLDGGAEALERRIAALEGIPIVINKWASWCGPCRQEFPALQQQAAERGDEVAFIGVNSADSVDAAETFLDGHPVPYPSYSDPDEEIATLFGAINFPETIFLDRDGDVAHVKSGPYLEEAELAADIERYGLSGG
ncbi:MAG: TlpA family protein disulfide reductase [Solirubrobacterales bacterium]